MGVQACGLSDSSGRLVVRAKNVYTVLCMDSAEVFSTVAALLALPVSVISVLLAVRSAKEARRQADSAELSLDNARQAGQSTTVIHFTNRFFDLIRDGLRFADPSWAQQFWGLQATEYYFFDRGWLPGFMYELWMVELVEAYRADAAVWASHEQYLDRFAVNYPEMVAFFSGLAVIANQEFATARDRNLSITRYLADKANRTTPRPREAAV